VKAFYTIFFLLTFFFYYAEASTRRVESSCPGNLHKFKTAEELNEVFDVGDYFAKDLDNYYLEYYLAREFSESDALKLAAQKSSKLKGFKSVDESYIQAFISNTPRVQKQLASFDDFISLFDRVTPLTNKEGLNSALLNAPKSVQESLLEVFNSFNSKKFAQHFEELTIEALERCRMANGCNNGKAISDKFLESILKEEAKRLDLSFTIITKEMGKLPYEEYMSLIRGGDLTIDLGALGDHGVYTHSIQHLFIYKTIGRERYKEMFQYMALEDVPGANFAKPYWIYDRLFDSGLRGSPVPSPRDLSRDMYLSGIYSASN
jgi:hypothetical protein